MIALALATGPAGAAARRARRRHGPRRGGARWRGASGGSRDDLGLGVIVVDHNMHFLMPLADTVR